MTSTDLTEPDAPTITFGDLGLGDAVLRAAGGFFPAGTPRWWIYRQRFWFRNNDNYIVS